MYLLLYKFPEGDDLLLATTEDGSISAFKTFGDVYKRFSSYEEAWTSGPSGNYGGAVLSMMNMQPRALEYDESPESLKRYVIDPTLRQLTIPGCHGKPLGVKVKASILEERKSIDIWKETMIRGRIYNPKESDLVGKQGDIFQNMP